MRAYIDHVLALKPFEPSAHQRLGGPPCTYVGHPVVERLAQLRPAPGERPQVGTEPVTVLVLPGSRRSEIKRLLQPFGEALAILQEKSGRKLDIVLPAVPHLAEEVRLRTQGWTVRVTIVEGEDGKHAAFRRANLALAASGTVTLELAISGVPMVVAYKVSKLEEQLKYLIKVPSIVLANLILGDNVIPERVQWDCTPEKLAEALLPLLAATDERQRQLEAFRRLDDIMEVAAVTTPSERAAAVVIAELERGRQSREAQGRCPIGT
jgi:lipid-A-disaccharide synthase